MSDYKLGAMELRFADLIWHNEPISSGELVKLCAEELEWKKSTTYTMLKRGIFHNNHSVLSSLLSKDAFLALQSEAFVAETFDGSLPRFLAAFTSRTKLSDQEIDQLHQLIDQNRR